MRRWRACRAPSSSCSSSWKRPVSSSPSLRGPQLEQDPVGLHPLPPAHVRNNPLSPSRPAHPLKQWAKTTEGSSMVQAMAAHPRGARPLHPACTERSAAQRKTFPCPPWFQALAKLRPNSPTTQRKWQGVRLLLAELEDLWVSVASWVRGTRAWTLRQAARHHWLSTRMTQTPPPTPMRTRLPWWPRAAGLLGHGTLRTAWTPGQAMVQFCSVLWHVLSVCLFFFFFFYTVSRHSNKCIVFNTALLSKMFCFHSSLPAHRDASVTFVLLHGDITGMV